MEGRIYSKGEVGVGVVDEGGGLETVFGGKDISWGRGEGGGLGTLRVTE